MVRKVKVTHVKEEGRADTIKRGVKHGSIKNTIDKQINKFGDPLVEKSVELFKRLHPNADITQPALDAFVKSGMMLGLAEVMEASKYVAQHIPGAKKIDPEKFASLGGYMRGYAGESAGTKTADGMFKIAPTLLGMLNNPALTEILSGLNEDDASDGDKPKQLNDVNPQHVDLESAVAMLAEDDDED